MTFGSITPQEVVLLNSVFIAAITEAADKGDPISPKRLCERIQPLFVQGERDFTALKRAALG